MGKPKQKLLTKPEAIRQYKNFLLDKLRERETKLLVEKQDMEKRMGFAMGFFKSNRMHWMDGKIDGAYLENSAVIQFIHDGEFTPEKDYNRYKK